MPSTSGTVRGRRRGERSPYRYHRARVSRVEVLSPHVHRVTLVGESLPGLPFAGPDQRVKLLLPPPGQRRPSIEGLETIWDLIALPEGVRPIMRTYTVRNHRPAAAEVDIDFAGHGALGPASRWVLDAQPGDEVALFGPASEYEPPDDTQWQLIVGDESALPAIGAIVESLPHFVRATVLAEIPDARDEQAFDTRAHVEVRWLHRNGTPAHESTLLLDAVRGLDLPAVPSYFWVAGEASVATGIRRHLVKERGVAKDDVLFTGYWRHGLSESDA